MSSITSKYAVPFNNRMSTVIDNVLTRTLIYSENEEISEIKNNGTGYLKIILPSAPLDQNCIGFKISVYCSNTLSFEGHLSGSSSDGYKWLYASVVQSDSSYISPKSVLFCHQYVDPNSSNPNQVGNVLKKILIGDNDTKWGTNVTVAIEYLSATLVTNSDGDSDQTTTSDINELTQQSEYNKVSSNYLLNYSDGWRFEIGLYEEYDSDTLTGEAIDTRVATVSLLDGSDSGSIVIRGAVEGTSEDNNGMSTITVEFPSNRINLVKDGVVGVIYADGSELINLDQNPAFINFIPNSTKSLTSPIILENTTNSDVVMRYQFQSPGTYKSTVSVRKLNLGTWDSSNIKEFSIKSTTDKSTMTSLSTGDLGLLVDGENTDLFIGVGSSTEEGRNYLVGGMKICSTDEELEKLYHFKGRTVFHNGVIKVSNGSEWIPMVLDSSGVIISMDSLRDGEFYKKIDANSVTNGYVNTITTINGDSNITGDDLNYHLNNTVVHVTQADKDRWNANSESTGNTYTKSEVNDRLALKSNIDHYHYYHDPVSKVISSDDGDSYLTGARVLFTSTRRIMIYDGESWSSSKYEEFPTGSIVYNIEDGLQYLNNGTGIVVFNSDYLTEEELSSTLADYVTGNMSYSLRTDNWGLVRSGNSLLDYSTNTSTKTTKLSLGLGIDNFSILSTNRPTYNGTNLMIDGDIDESKFATAVHYHRNHEPVKSIVATLPTTGVSEGDRYLLHEQIKERRNNKWVDDPSSIGDTVFNSDNNKLYTYNGSLWSIALLADVDGGLKYDDANKIVHSNSIEDPTDEIRPKLYSLSFDGYGHITKYSAATLDDIDSIDASKLVGKIPSETIPLGTLDTSGNFINGVLLPGSGTMVSQGSSYLNISYLPSYQDTSSVPSTFNYTGVKSLLVTQDKLGMTSSTDYADILLFSGGESKIKDDGSGNTIANSSYRGKTNALILTKDSSNIYLAQGEYGSNSWDSMRSITVTTTIGASDELSSSQLAKMNEGDYYVFEGAYTV